MTKKCAFIGLGVMGYPMAGHLTKNGFDVTVFNRTSTKSESWTREFTGKLGLTPAEASVDCDYVFVCVGNDDDVRSVIYGQDGALSGMKKGAILVDHTTASPALAVELAKTCSEKEVEFMDGPVSGGQAGAINGKLTVMLGGNESTHEKVKTAIASYAANQTLIGPHGHGQITKMVNQVCIGGLLQGLSEGIYLGESHGVDLDKVFAAISKGAAQSWQMENRASTMIAGKFDFGFALDWMRKDLTICLEAAKDKKIELPVTDTVKNYYDQLSSRGMGRCDTSSLVELLRSKKSS